MVYLRNNEQITNSDYQRLNHVDSVIANRELSGLIQIGLIKQHKTKRWAFYTLNVPMEKELISPPQTDEEKVLAHVQQQGSISRLNCRILLNISDIQAKYFLQKMHQAKKLRLIGRGRGSKYVLP